MHFVPGDSEGREPALCGLRPGHGWGCDLFIEEPCARCYKIAKAQGIEIPEESERAYANKLRVKAAMARY